ncbi:unnamed protein product [Anisakis simplex]|uniref:Carboxylic ester hydrolase n=1 Tax=Anisakis simplex TaxID=6269 RepID=A0A158PN20_ANISI|nr:unnamed protein product [Anisakis simplex]
MLYIHAGHLRSGSASECGVNGIVRNLVSRGVVVVIIQYRLGTLGFFTTMDEEFPPNLGMLDQVEAIKFVHKHINKFGGDPKQLTLFGESAGAASISAHTYSPMTKELFHKAILQSGSIYLSLDGVFGMSRNSHAIAKSVCNIDLPTKGKLNKTTQRLTKKCFVVKIICQCLSESFIKTTSFCSKLKKCMMEADATKFLLFERASFSYFLSQKNCQHQDELISQVISLTVDP